MRNNDLQIPPIFLVIWLVGAALSIGVTGFLLWMVWLVVKWLIHAH